VPKAEVQTTTNTFSGIITYNNMRKFGMPLRDYLNGPKYLLRIQELDKQLSELQQRYTQMQVLAEKFRAMESIQIQDLIDQENVKLANLRMATQESNRQIAELRKKSDELRSQVLVFEETLLLESFALYEPKFKFNASHEYKTRLDSVRETQKALIKNGQAATGNMGWEVNGSKAEGRKLVNDMIKLVIRSFNNEADYCVDNVKFDNIELGEKRIRKSFETCNKLGRVMTVSLSEKYLNLKLDELRLSHERSCANNKSLNKKYAQHATKLQKSENISWLRFVI
jgi:hypothetical protein